MSGKIFVNYRRDDDPGYTQALYQRLEDEFASGDLFMDVEGHIKPGDDFVEVLNAQVAASDVFLAVIGPRWGELLAARQGDHDDFVAIEIEAALDQGKRVIPVLVGGASVPRADVLPEAIRQLARRNAVGLRPERAEKERAARTETERAAAEFERRKREAEEAARIAMAEERASAQRIAGLWPEEIREAEELANWDFIKERGRPQALRDHLARFSDGVTMLYARTRLEELTWSALGASPDMESLRAFRDEFPKGINAEVAKERLASLVKLGADKREAEQRRQKETEEWAEVAASTEPGPLIAFLKRWPDGQHANAGKSRISRLKGGSKGWMIAVIAIILLGLLQFAAGLAGVMMLRQRGH